jgi:hypothetical protein
MSAKQGIARLQAGLLLPLGKYVTNLASCQDEEICTALPDPIRSGVTRNLSHGSSPQNFYRADFAGFLAFN